MEFRVLGPTELWSAGQHYDLGSTKERAVLAILALTPRIVVPAEVMIDRLWDTRPPTKARATLTAYVTRLRAVLREASGESIRLAGRANGYVLDVDPEAVDLHQFRRLRRQAEAVRSSGDFDRAAELLRDADALWRGQAFAGIRGDWIARMRDSIEQERRAAVLERVECEFELGRHTDLVGELGGLLAQHPLDETLVAHQMTALYWSGRAGDALRLYRETRSRLVDEQGSEPGPALSELHRRILRREPRLVVRLASRRPGGAVQLDTLPPEKWQFVGRSAELALLTEESGDGPRVSVIEGMVGVGKTTLAVHAARMIADKYADGLFYVNLQAHDPDRQTLDSSEALNRLLRMLGVPSEQVPDSVGARAAMWRSQLSRRRALVILDDVTRRDQIRPLLPAAGQCMAMITTRRKLADLVGARVLGLDVLSLEEAVALFTRIAGTGDAAERDDVATVVRLCGRLPLAVRLMAGRLAHDRSMSVADLVEELSNSRAWLRRTDSPSPELTSAFDSSYRELEADHQGFFRRLGLSPCTDFSLPGAAVIGGTALAEAEKVVTALLDHHLLTRAPVDRYRFHELVRGYVAVRAAHDEPEPEQRQAVGRLLDYYLHATDEADRVLHPFWPRSPVTIPAAPAVGPVLGRPDDAARWLGLEWRNILQLTQHAARHEWKPQCADLTHLVAGYLDGSGHWHEAIAAHTLALQAARDLADPARIARASLELGVANQQTGRLEAAAALAEDRPRSSKG
jgi:DNA-binding SARP family transcriptional activator